MAYNPPRKYNLFDPTSSKPFSLSRGKIENFLKCPRCFYLDRRLGIDQPPLPGFSLNVAVDQLMKKEFDILRKSKKRHELMKKFKIDAVPFDHPDITAWRDDIKKFEGANFLHKQTNLKICGIIDDVWINPTSKLHIVDYKSTSTSREISLEDEYKQTYKKQIELYQWIFRQNGFKVSDIGYFVFANAKKTPEKFDGVLEFEMQIISHKGDDSWVERTVFEIKKCLMSDTLPPSTEGCEYCAYRKASKPFDQKAIQGSLGI